MCVCKWYVVPHFQACTSNNNTTADPPVKFLENQEGYVNAFSLAIPKQQRIERVLFKVTGPGRLGRVEEKETVFAFSGSTE